MKQSCLNILAKKYKTYYYTVEFMRMKRRTALSILDPAYVLVARQKRFQRFRREHILVPYVPILVGRSMLKEHVEVMVDG